MHDRRVRVGGSTTADAPPVAGSRPPGLRHRPTTLAAPAPRTVPRPATARRPEPAPADAAPSVACPHCGTQVRRCRHPDGRPVLVDPEPTPSGRLIINPTGLVIGTLPLTAARRTGEPGGFLDHAAACPGPAAEQRRPPRRRWS